MRTASTDSKPGSYAARSRDRGHHPPSTQPVVGAFGFNRSRSRSRESSTGRADDAGRRTDVVFEMVNGPTSCRRPRPPAATAGSGTSVEDDANLTTRIRDAPDTRDTTPFRGRETACEATDPGAPCSRLSSRPGTRILGRRDAPLGRGRRRLPSGHERPRLPS